MNEEELRKIKIILASGSARRKEIFEKHGIDPMIMPMDVDETLPDAIAPHDAVMYLSLKKGLAAESYLSETGQREKLEHALIVSADTIVYARDITTDKWTIMGKPEDRDDALRMVSSIRGTSHKVYTGVTVINISDDPAVCVPKLTFYDVTDVFVKDITDVDMESYIDSGEPFGKAGGYAIQLGFGRHISHINGDYENVVGFPYNHFIQELRKI